MCIRWSRALTTHTHCWCRTYIARVSSLLACFLFRNFYESRFGVGALRASYLWFFTLLCWCFLLLVVVVGMSCFLLGTAWLPERKEEEAAGRGRVWFSGYCRCAWIDRALDWPGPDFYFDLLRPLQILTVCVGIVRLLQVKFARH